MTTLRCRVLDTRPEAGDEITAVLVTAAVLAPCCRDWADVVVGWCSRWCWAASISVWRLTARQGACLELQLGRRSLFRGRQDMCHVFADSCPAAALLHASGLRVQVRGSGDWCDSGTPAVRRPVAPSLPGWHWPASCGWILGSSQSVAGRWEGDLEMGLAPVEAAMSLEAVEAVLELSRRSRPASPEPSLHGLKGAMPIWSIFTSWGPGHDSNRSEAAPRVLIYS